MKKALKNAAKSIKATTKGLNKKAAEKEAPADKHNPFRPGSSYHAVIASLVALGVNKAHDLEKVSQGIKKQMAGAGTWKDFAAKKGKLTADQRILVNTQVTARSDFGQPVRDLGWEVRWDGREKTAGLFRFKK